MTRKRPVVTISDGIQQPKQGRADLNGAAFVKSFPQLSNSVALRTTYLTGFHSDVIELVPYRYSFCKCCIV